MKNKIVKILPVIMLAIMLTFLTMNVVMASNPWGTTSLGEKIDEQGQISYDYLGVLLTHFWPMLIGMLIIGAILGFVISWIMGLGHKR